MTDVLASLLIPQAYQDTDGLVNEPATIPATGPYTWRLGQGLSPAYPSGAALIPAGAAPLPQPPALTAGAGVASGGLVNNGTYSWAMTLVTKFGETQPSLLLPIVGIGSGNTGQTLNLPAGTTGTGTNPVLSRRIWRYKNGGSQLYLVTEIDDANVSVYVDEVPDSELVATAPTGNTSGLEGAVSIIGTNSASNTTWVEMPEGATLTAAGQYTVSYDISNAGGIVTFYSGDHGIAVTIQYVAGTELGSTYFNLYKAALQTIHDRLNAGMIRQSIRFDLDHDGSGDITVDTTHNAGNTGLFNSYANPKQWSITTTGGDLEVEFTGWPWNYLATTGNWILLAVCVDLGPAYLLASASTTAAAAAFNATTGTPAEVASFGGKKVFRGLAAGAHTVYLLLQAGGSGGGTSAGFKKGSNTSWFSAGIKEIG